MQSRFSSSSLRPLRIIATFVATVLTLALALPARADQSANPHVFPPTARPFGKSYARWSAQWWIWALSRPVAGHPFVEPGFACNGPDNGQHGPVWFLALSSAPPVVERICAIPEDTAVFVGIVNAECSSLEPTFPDGTGGQTEALQRECANFYANHIVLNSLFCTLDGEPVKHLRTSASHPRSSTSKRRRPGSSAIRAERGPR
ncbi:MAG TPA: hypothetical protein VLW55_00190 [Burkholderiaceae bacterium]|nr:hypothetical protein [Burkholderiaceae bacterium]